MGKGFGELAYVRGMIYYTLSPYQQRAFAGMIKEGIPNLIRRTRYQIFRVVPRMYRFDPFICTLQNEFQVLLGSSTLY